MFLKLLEDLDHGRTLQDLDEDLRKVTQAVRETGNAGKVTLELTISKESDRAVVTPKLKATVPRVKPASSLFFFDYREQGSLVREDPRQLALRTLPEQERKELDS